jgi:hypothetical protein
MPQRTHELPCKCLTEKGVFALIRGFPNGFQSLRAALGLEPKLGRAIAFRRTARAAPVDCGPGPWHHRCSILLQRACDFDAGSDHLQTP